MQRKEENMITAVGMKNKATAQNFNKESVVDFFVEFEENKDIVILQLSDMQIIDSAQQRYQTRLTPEQYNYWVTENMDERCFNPIRETIESVKPDFIIISGDLVYGEFDDKGTSFTKFVDFMESFGILWAPVFGNHDNESKMGVDWQCRILESAEHCIFKQRRLTGNGNYTVGIVQGTRLKRVFYMLDSNGCGSISDVSMANGHSKSTPGFGDDQMKWIKSSAKKIKTTYPDTKLSFVFHIQTDIFKEAYSKYGFTGSGTNENPINIDEMTNRADGDLGYIGADLKNEWDKSNEVYDMMKKLGVDSVFVGHEHANNASVVYDGIRFQYGQKSSTYDRARYRLEDGTIEASFIPIGTPIIGGTAFCLSQEDASIKNVYIYNCKNCI